MQRVCSIAANDTPSSAILTPTIWATEANLNISRIFVRNDYEMLEAVEELPNMCQHIRTMWGDSPHVSESGG